MAKFTAFAKKRYNQLLGRLGTKKLLEASGKELRKSIRVNTLKISVKELKKRLERKGFELEPVPWCKRGFWVEESKYSVGATTEYLAGYYFIQTSTSMIPAQELNPKPGEVVLEMAAAPGGKLTHASDLMKNKGAIIGMDIDSWRIRKLRSNVQRMGVENEVLYRMDAAYAEETGIKYDKILLDAPCSGEGLVIKKPSQGERITQRRIVQNSRIQKKLVETAYKVLKKGGTMVYSTCTYAPEENELVLQRAINQGFKIEKLDLKHGSPPFENPFGVQLPSEVSKARRFWPHEHGTEGFFVAKLRK